MQHTTLLHWWYTNVLNKRRYDALKEEYGSLDDALADFDSDMLKAIGVRSSDIPEFIDRHRRFNRDAYEAQMQKLGVKVLSIEDDAYPEILKEIGDPPMFLSYKGDLSILDQPMLGVVGTRRMSHYGQRVTEAFVPVFVRAGVITVSGLALGIDAVAARQTMESCGRTVAVLGHGLASIFPTSNTDLADRIVEKGGLLISEFPLDFPPEKYTFPARNRIIAGLSLGTVVIEAPEDSGAIITAELALEYGREVFAVPGQIFDEHMAGCHKLIAHGQARLVHSAEEVLKEIGIVADGTSAPALFLAGSIDEELVHRSLNGMPQSMDSLVDKTGLDPARIGTALTMIEIAGAAKNVGGGQWVRV